MLDKVKRKLSNRKKATLLDQVEKRFIQLEENLIHSQELASIGSWTHNMQTDEIFLTKELYHILNCSPHEFDGKLENYYLFIHPDDLEKVKQATQDALWGKEYDIEYRIITPGKLVKYVHEKTKVIYDKNKKPIKMVGIIQDITDHKLLENDLKLIGDNFNQAQRVAGVGSWKYDVIKDEYYGTEEMFRIYGITPSEFNGNFRNALKLAHHEDQDKVKEAMEKHINGIPCQCEYRIPQSDGSMKYVIGKGEPIFGDNQQVIGIIGTLQDITEKKLLEEKLEKSHNNLVKAQKIAQIGSWEMDLISGENYWSEETYHIFDMDPKQSEVPYDELLKSIHPDDLDFVKNVLINNDNMQVCEIEFRTIRPDGSIRYMYTLMEFTYDLDGRLTNIHGTTQDITEKKVLQKEIDKRQENINKLQRRFQVLVQESSDVFEILAPDGTIKYISEASEKVIGYKPEDRVGKKVYEYYEGDELQKSHEMMDMVLNNPSKIVQRDICLKNKTGKEIHLDVIMQNLLHEPTIEGIVVNFRDITKRKEMENQILHISTHDELTGIPNRNYFKQKLGLIYQKALKTNTGFAVMMLEVDGLKYINDALGYQVGDQLILEITKTLKLFLGDSIFISRYSGVVFALMVDDKKTISEYEKFAREIIALFLQPFKIGNYELSMSINIGISLLRDDKQDIDMLINHSELALFWAKKEGKSKYKFYSSDISIQNYKQFGLRNDLRKALGKNQFKVYYQPIVNLNTNEILAAEALIRWEHPSWGMVSPNEFITLAEETSEIITIGNWILLEVCRNYKKWQEQGYSNIKISINVSCIQFFDDNFVNNIIKTIDKFKLDPNFLIIEITESILMVNQEKAIADIKRLQSLGIQIALDDFGTGYSSLSYLNIFNIDILKIDGSFVKNSILDNNSSIIIKTIIQMARELKIKLVAEGIENWQQLSFLQELKCYAGQGYIYAKPQPLEDYERILVKRKLRPIIIDDTEVKHREDRRKYFRIDFPLLLEGKLLILEIKGEKVNVGNTNILIKNIGPGGLCFISNINLPVDNDIIMKFTTYLLGKEISVNGCTVWMQEIDYNLFKYGVEFTLDENKRASLTQILNQIQIKLKNDILFSEYSFVSESPEVYFK